MQAVMRDPILNKVSFMTADPAFRHIVGQQRSTIDLVAAIDAGAWILLNLSKGQLGEQAQTLGSFFLAKLKTAVFRRRNRELFTVYCDEVQNLVAFDDGFETLLSEIRKQAVAMVTANQHLEQLTPVMRAAMMAVQTHLIFLPQRRALMQSGNDRVVQVQIPQIDQANTATADLRDRVRARWARSRTEIEREIQQRRGHAVAEREALNEWD
jgi:hypothetical protein